MNQSDQAFYEIEAKVKHLQDVEGITRREAIAIVAKEIEDIINNNPEILEPEVTIN